jgi:hypothetical protein
MVNDHVVLSVGERGPVVAESLLGRGGGTTLIGVPVTFAEICSAQPGPQLCESDTYYSATVHGDSDLILTPGSSGHVKVGGIEYVVWLDSAYSETIAGNQSTCAPDWAPPSGFSIVARVVRYGDVIVPPARDAGPDSG